MSDETPPLEALVAAVLRTQKYRNVAPDLVRRLGARELAQQRSFADAVKATKGKLHQVAAVYLPATIDYDAALSALRYGATAGDETLRTACRDLMAQHVSTRERLPILDRFYAETLAGLSPRVIIDVACGLGPLAIPWLPLAEPSRYLAYDAYTDLAAFLSQCWPLLGVEGSAYARDVVSAPPTEHGDLALLLKAVPCLEQQGRGAALRLLDALDVDYMLVSFPVSSIGGRRKGMHEHYEDTFLAMVQERPWRLTRFTFATELAFLVDKRGTANAPSV